MLFSNVKRIVIAMLISLVSMGIGSQARADIDDYEFQLIQTEIKKGDAVIAVRLVNKTTGKPVPDAVIFATRLDMEPEGMQEMVTKVMPMPSSESGVYKFKASLGMAGGWQLSLGAKIQGENGTVQSKLVFKAVS